MAVIINDLEVVLPAKTPAAEQQTEQSNVERRQSGESPLSPADIEQIVCHLQQRALRVTAH